MDRAYRRRPLSALLASVVLGVPCASAQPSQGPVALSLAGAIAARDDGRQTTFNPATADFRGRFLVASGAMSAGGLSGLVDAAVVVNLPVDSSRAICGSLGAVGYGSYRLVELASSVAVRIGASLVGGAGVRIETQSIDHYGTSASILLDAGATMQLTPALALGVAARNVTASSLRGLPRPQQIGIGARLALSDSVALSVDLLHEAGRGAHLDLAISMRVAPGIEARAGLRADGSLAAAGFGYDDGERLVDVALAWIDALGPRIAAGAGVRW